MYTSFDFRITFVFPKIRTQIQMKQGLNVFFLKIYDIQKFICFWFGMRNSIDIFLQIKIYSHTKQIFYIKKYLFHLPNQIWVRKIYDSKVQFIQDICRLQDLNWGSIGWWVQHTNHSALNKCLVNPIRAVFCPPVVFCLYFLPRLT